MANYGALLVAIGALCAPSAARAATHTQQLDVSAGLVRQPKGQPWIVSLGLGADLGMDDGTIPVPIRHMVFRFTRGAKVHPEAFATCTADTLEHRGTGACPSTSRLGRGTATVSVLKTTVPATLTVFNGPRPDRLLIYARALGTVSIIMQGTLRKAVGSGSYGWILDLPVPRIPTVGPAENDASILAFHVTVGGTGRKGVPFLQAPTSCAAPGWPFQGAFTYADGAVGTAASVIPCVLQGTPR
jgi:hypothetical protein